MWPRTDIELAGCGHIGGRYRTRQGCAVGIVAPMDVVLIGGPAPYREAISGRLEERGFTAAAPDAEPERPCVAVVYCDDEEHWSELAERADRPGTCSVAVLPAVVLDDYIRALVAGASGVVYIDTPSEPMVDSIEAAVDGEVRLPRQAAQSMASLARRESPSPELGAVERALLTALAEGRTLVDLADELHFSERTIRRHLQNIYLKLGVSNRAEAIVRAARLGLTP